MQLNVRMIFPLFIALHDGQRLPIILYQQKVWQEYFHGSFDKNISTESLTRIFPRNLWQEYFHGKSDKNIFSETFPFFFTCYVFRLLNPRLEISRILKDSRHFKFFGTFFALSVWASKRIWKLHDSFQN